MSSKTLKLNKLATHVSSTKKYVPPRVQNNGWFPEWKTALLNIKLSGWLPKSPTT